MLDHDPVHLQMQGHGRPGRLGVLIQNAVEDLLVSIDCRGQQLLASDIGDGDHRRVNNGISGSTTMLCEHFARYQ